MPDIHAKLCSPSGAEGWWHCAGRAVMEADFTDSDTDYSADGSARHEVCAATLLCLNGERETVEEWVGHGIDVHGKTVTYKPEWVEEDQDYVDTVRALAEGGELFVERRVNFETYTGVKGDSFGTADAIVINKLPDGRGFGSVKHELIVVDRKTGYVEVSPERNKQLMLYALGALAEFGMVYDIARVRLVIHQRKAREWDCSIDELLQFAEQARAAAALVVDAVSEHGKIDAATWQRVYLNPDPSEQACAYCRAQATCPAMRAAIEKTVGMDFATVESVPQVATDDEVLLSQQMAKVGLVEDWTKAVRAEVERRLLAGKPVPGFKLVLGKAGARKWSDEKAAEDMLRKQFRLPVEKAYDLSLISPTTAEKLKKAGDLGERQWKKAEALITRSEPKPSVAPITDKRDAYVPPDAADDFAPIPESQPQEAEAGLALV